jgi:hypothetical protein
MASRSSNDFGAAGLDEAFAFALWIWRCSDFTVIVLVLKLGSCLGGELLNQR